MTNKEKAKEIAMPCKGCECEWTKEKMYKQQYCKDCVAQDKFIAAMQAMNWKDEQFLQWLKENLAKETFTMFTSESQGVINFETIIKSFEKFIKQ